MLTVIARKGNFKMRINESTYVDALKSDYRISESFKGKQRKNKHCYYI